MTIPEEAGPVATAEKAPLELARVVGHYRIQQEKVNGNFKSNVPDLRLDINLDRSVRLVVAHDLQHSAGDLQLSDYGVIEDDGTVVLQLRTRNLSGKLKQGTDGVWRIRLDSPTGDFIEAERMPDR